MLKRLKWGLWALSLSFGCSSDGADGDSVQADEAEAIEEVLDEPAGENCEFGGTAISTGTDENENGELDRREITGTEYECNPAPEIESRLVISELDVGDSDCPGGGTKMERGLDENQNGELDPREVEMTDFLCNPVIEPESRLVITPLEVGDADCPGGGSRLDRGADLDGDGDIAGAEVESSDLICNDVRAPAILARASELEVGSEQCPEGGVAVYTGPDSDGDGVLSDAEATETSLVCDDPELVITCAVPYEWKEAKSGCVLRDDWSGASLGGADLGNVYLAGIDFSGAELENADLHHAELRDANLTGANLAGANLSHVSLDGADLTGAVLDGADLTGVDLSGAVLGEISAVGLEACPEVLPEGWRCPDFGASGLTLTWPGMSLEGLDLSGAELTWEDLYGLQPLGITGCPASLPDGWVCSELGDYGMSLFGPGADLGGLDLAGVDFSEASNLNDVSFEGSDLTGASFGDGTTFDWVDFAGADLSNASFGANTTFTGTHFSETTFTGTTFGAGTSFHGTTIKHSSLEGVDLSGVSLSGVHAVSLLGCPSALPSEWSCVNSANGFILAGPGADLTGVDLNGANLSAVNLSGANFTGGSLEGATLEGANLAEATLHDAHGHALVGCPAQLPPQFVCREGTLLGPNIHLGGVDLTGMVLSDLNLSGAYLGGATLAQADLRFTNLTGADLYAANLTGADLRGANLSRANLYGATVTGALVEETHWDLTICPDGSYSGVGSEQGCFTNED